MQPYPDDSGIRILMTQGPLRNPLQPPGRSAPPSARSGSGLYPSPFLRGAITSLPCTKLWVALPTPRQVTAIAICSEMHRRSENNTLSALRTVPGLQTASGYSLAAPNSPRGCGPAASTCQDAPPAQRGRSEGISLSPSGQQLLLA